MKVSDGRVLKPLDNREGWLKIGGREYAIRGLSLRDHGWGPWDWSSVLSHRGVAGSCGPELSFVAVPWHTVDEGLASFGWVVRGDTVTHARPLDVLACVEIDAATNRGGHLRYTLTTGEVLDIECEAVTVGVVSCHANVCCVDVLCRAHCGSLIGFCDFETTADLQYGQRRPVRMFNAIIDNGFFPSAQGC